MQFRPDYWRLGGAAGAGALADYVDLRMQPYSQRMTNSELLALLLVGADVFNVSARYPKTADAVRGAADYGMGLLTAALLRQRLVPPVVTVPVPTTTSKSTTTPSKSASASGAGVAGVTANAGSQVLDLPMGY